MKMRWMTLCGIICLLLAACTPDTINQETTDAPTTTGIGVENLTEYDPAMWPVLLPYTGTPLLEADPEREIYVSLSNQDCDFYPGLPYQGIAFDLFTRTAYAPEDISVELSIQSGYHVSVTVLDDAFQHIDLDPETNCYGYGGQMPYHYLCIQDVDLHTLGQLRSDAEHAGDIYYSKLVPQNLATQEDYKTLIEGYVDTYTAMNQPYQDAYRAQGDTLLTDCHVYSINITFDRYRDETVEYLELRLGDETCRIDFGQWRFHSQEPEELSFKHKGINTDAAAIVATPYDSPYAGGYINLYEAIRFTTNEDITLTGLRWAGGGALEVLGARIESTTDGSAMDFMWDSSQPRILDKGTGAKLSVYLYSETLKEYEACFTGFLYLDYTLVDTGAEYTVAVPCRIKRYNSELDTYCLAFLGVDVGEYYHYFQDEILQVQWLDEIPGSWRKEK